MLTSSHQQSKRQTAIEISHFLCLLAWPLRSGSGEAALKFKYII